MRILETINSHQDLLRLTAADREVLCEEIREFLVSNVAKTGGHLASNLGVVELTVALETVFDTGVDRLVFDVGHQSYVHKLLTGRREEFSHLRQYGGMSGFPKPCESQADAFVAGHASSSVSIALGMAKARTLQHQNYHVLAMIGDGATTGGLAYEGLNNAAVSREPMIVILNDNAMSIDHNVGGIARHLSRLRSSQAYLGLKRRVRRMTENSACGKAIFYVLETMKNRVKRILLPTTIFENMGFTYLGPVDGNDVEELISLLSAARDLRRPVLVHVMTKKGCGYLPAEEDPARFHGIGKFDPLTGKSCGKSAHTFSDAFGVELETLASRDPRICAMTAAMPGGTGLLPFKARFPDRTFDVGIAEEHAVSMAGGLAKQGMVPVVAIYSTFLQRAYDMIMQDVAILHLHVVFAVDRAGLVGEDGETHHGIFDVGYLRQVPGMELLCPAGTAELQQMLDWAVEVCDGPVAVRYPRGGDCCAVEPAWDGTRRVVCHRRGTDGAIVVYGTMLAQALRAAELLEAEGISVSVLRLLCVAPLPVEELVDQLPENRKILTVEEVCSGSGIREALAWALTHRLPDCLVDGLDLGRRFVTQGDLKTLYHAYGIDGEAIAAAMKNMVKGTDGHET